MAAYAALVADLKAELGGFKKGMDEAVKIAQTSSSKIEKAFSFSSVLKAGVGFFLAQVGAQSLREFLVLSKELTDEWTRSKVLIENVTGSLTEAADAQRRLYQIAQQTRQNYGELTKTFASFSRNAGELGISTDQAVNLQKTVAQAVALSGARADSAASALVQFSQGIAAGVLRGEELNSVLEQTPRLAKAIAEGMEVPVSQLLKMGKEGELTADKIIRALERIAPKLQEEFDKVIPTIADGFVTLRNSIGNLLNAMQTLLPPGAELARILTQAARDIDTVARGISRAPDAVALRDYTAKVNELAEAERNLQALRDRPDTPARNTGIPKAEEAVRVANERLEAARRSLEQRGLNADGSLIVDDLNFLGRGLEAGERRRTRTLTELDRVKQQINGISNDFLTKAATIINARINAPTDVTYEEMIRLIEELKKVSGITKAPKKPEPEKPDVIGELILELGDKSRKELARIYEDVQRVIDPLRELKEELSNVDRLATLGVEFGGISGEDAAKARLDIEQRITDEKNKQERKALELAEPLTAVREELNAYLEQIRIESNLLDLTEVQREARVRLLDAERKGLEQNTQEWNKYREEIEAALKGKRLAEIDRKKYGPSDARTEDLMIARDDLQASLDEANFLGLDVQADAFERWNERVTAILGATELVKDAAFKLGEAFESAFEDAVVAGEDFKSVMEGLADDILKIFLRSQITGPLAEFINSSTKGIFGGKTLFELFTGIAPKASGGPVAPGKPYLVGEKGPELIIPKLPGAAAPNKKLGSLNDEDLFNALKGMLPTDKMGAGPTASKPYLVGEKGPELIVPKAAGTVVPNDELEKLSGKELFNVLMGVFPKEKTRASGGPVAANESFLVGEKGPELFVPKSSGTVVSNANLGKMGGVTVVNNISVDSRSDRASIMQMMDTTLRATQATILDQRARGMAV
jgi:tape measure domain-containing protein